MKNLIEFRKPGSNLQGLVLDDNPNGFDRNVNNFPRESKLDRAIAAIIKEQYGSKGLIVSANTVGVKTNGGVCCTTLKK